MLNIYGEALCENSSIEIVPRYKFAVFFTSRNEYYELVTPEVAILCKKNLWQVRVVGTVNFCYTYIQINLQTYLHLITVLVYRNSSQNS